MKLTVNNVRAILDTLDEHQLDYEEFGLRVDTGIVYKIGDICNNSRQLYQDPMYDEDDNLIYPEIKDGINAGYYDGGELDGTCCVSLGNLTDDDISKAIENLYWYLGNVVHLIAGEKYTCGEDYYNREIIIADAKVIGIFEVQENDN